MKVYNYSMYGEGTVLVTPGSEHPETTEFVDPKTRSPVMFTVRFSKGMAEVSDAVGKYMIANKLAQKSRVILHPQNAEEQAALAEQAAQVEQLRGENQVLKEKLKRAGIE